MLFIVASSVLAPEAALARNSTHIRIFVGTVTAYTSSPKAVTASGVPPSSGIVACPRRYPLGTRFRIEGKIYECRDRLSRKYEGRLDIWKPTDLAARLFGKRKLPIVALMPSDIKSIAAELHLRLVRE